MRNFLFSLSVAILFPVILLAEESPKYRVAAILPLTGSVASLGQYLKKGILLAYNRLDSSKRDSIELIFEDDQFDPKQTLAAYRRISNDRPLDAIFVLGSNPALALAPVTEAKRQILVAIGASDPEIIRNRKYAFIHWIIPSTLGERLAQELIHRDLQNIAFVTAEASGALADTNGAVDALKALKQENRIVYNETFEKGQTDFQTPIERIRSKKADAVVVVLFPGALSSFTKQARQLKLPGEIVGMETFEDESEVKASEGSLMGKWYVNAANPTKEFTEIYQKAWGELPGWASGNAFDSLNLIVEASQQSHDSEKIRGFLANLRDYHGAIGIYSASGDNRFSLPAAIKRVTKDGFITVSLGEKQLSE